MSESDTSQGVAVFDALVNKQFQAIFEAHLSAFPNDPAFTSSLKLTGRIFDDLSSAWGLQCKGRCL